MSLSSEHRKRKQMGLPDGAAVMSIADQVTNEGDNMIVYHDSLPGKMTLGLPTFLYDGTIKSSCTCPGNRSDDRGQGAATSKLVSVMHPRSIALRFDATMVENLSARCFEKSEFTRVNKISWVEDLDRRTMISTLKRYVCLRSGVESGVDWMKIFNMIAKHNPCIITIEFVSDTLLNNVAADDNVLSLFFIYHGKAIGLMGWVCNVAEEAVERVSPNASSEPPGRPVSCTAVAPSSHPHLLELMRRPHSTVPILRGRPGEESARKAYSLPLPVKAPSDVEVVKPLTSEEEFGHDSVLLPPILPPKMLIEADDEEPILLPKPRTKRRRSSDEAFLQLPVFSPPADGSPKAKKKRKEPEVTQQRQPNLQSPVQPAVWGLPEKYPCGDASLEPVAVNTQLPPPPPGMAWQPISNYLSTATSPIVSNPSVPSLASPPVAYQPPVSLNYFPQSITYSQLPSEPSDYHTRIQLSPPYSQGRLLTSPIPPLHVGHYQASCQNGVYQPQPPELVQGTPLSSLQNMPYPRIEPRNLNRASNPSYDPSGSFRVPQSPVYRRRLVYDVQG